MPGAINEADIKLMLAMIASAEGLKTDNEKLAEIIGGGVSANAIRQRVAKVKTLAKAVLAGEDTDLSSKSGGTPKATTPAKRKADGDEGQTPSKKRTGGKIKGGATPKGRKGKKTEDEDVIKAEDAGDSAVSLNDGGANPVVDEY